MQLIDTFNKLGDMKAYWEQPISDKNTVRGKDKQCLLLANTLLITTIRNPKKCSHCGSEWAYNTIIDS